MRTVSLLGAMVVLATAQESKTATSELLKIAETYESYGKVDDEIRWAPTLCRRPNPPVLRASASDDEKTHGKKLYYLFAKDRNAYVGLKDKTQPLGQVLVKESWVPAASSTKEKPVAERHGGLFIMMKTGGSDSDEGWIYATTSADRKTITSSGKIASCMDCHQGKTRDRLFGMPQAK